MLTTLIDKTVKTAEILAYNFWGPIYFKTVFLESNSEARFAMGGSRKPDGQMNSFILFASDVRDTHLLQLKMF